MDQGQVYRQEGDGEVFLDSQRLREEDEEVQRWEDDGGLQPERARPGADRNGEANVSTSRGRPEGATIRRAAVRSTEASFRLESGGG